MNFFWINQLLRDKLSRMNILIIILRYKLSRIEKFLKITSYIYFLTYFMGNKGSYRKKSENH